jgi:hypothetical protein
MRLSDAHKLVLEQSIANDPTIGDLIPGLQGVRKVRFAMRDRGKRGGGRAIYYLMMADDLAIMLTAYAKNEQEDLSPDQKKAILAVLKELDNG